VSLELDAREGEHQVETTTIDSVKQLQVLLGKPGKAGNGQGVRAQGKMPGLPHRAQTAQAAESVPASNPLPQVAPKPTKARVGQRGAVRAISLGKPALPRYAQPSGVRLPKSLKCR